MRCRLYRKNSMEKFRILYDLKAARESVCVAQCIIAPDIEQRLARMPVCTVYNISQAIPSVHYGEYMY